jgi:hypothetical protein
MPELVAQHPVSPDESSHSESLVVDDADVQADGWIPATDLISGARLEELFEHPQHLFDMPPHAAVVLAWKRYTRGLAGPLAAAWTLAREVPLLSADNVLIRLIPVKPHVQVGLRRTTRAVLATSPAAASRDAIVLADDASQLAFVDSTLIDQHLRPLFDRTMQTRRAGARTLWGQVAAGFAYGFRDASATAGTTAIAAAVDTARFAALLPMQDLAGVGPDGAVWRNTCCFSRTSPHLNACRNCVTVVRRAETRA